MHPTLPLSLSKAELAAFCQRWQITELALFGSALRLDFGPDSDIDLLVMFASGAEWSLLEHMRMELELVELFQHKVDLIDRSTLELSANPRRRAAILNTFTRIFSAHEVGSLHIWYNYNRYVVSKRLQRSNLC